MVTGLHRKVTFPAILALLIVTMLSPVGPSQGNEYTVTPVIRLSYERLMAAQSVQRALRFLEQADIESDPDGGAISRQSLLARAGLEYVQTDQAGNMFGVLRGARTGDTVAVAAGVRSFRALLLVAQAFKASGARTVVDVGFYCNMQDAATVGFSASGVESLLRNFQSVGAFVYLDEEGASVIHYPLQSYASDEAARQNLAVQAACAAHQSLGVQPKLETLSGGDSTLPIGAGIAAIRLGLGGGILGPQGAFMTVAGIAGVDGVTAPFVAWSSDPCT